MDLIRIGAFELYPSERKLCSAGKSVELGARAFDMLLVLAEHRGRLVTKATLLERVWPRVIVDENNLPAQVASLRRILGADAIRTVPGFGYRLELEVSTGQAEAVGPSSSVISGESDVPRLSISRDTWPHRLGPLIGRDAEVLDVQEALVRARLVTIVGAAGVGKTRLAQEILAHEAEQPGAQVAWISLASLVAVQHVPSAIALALGVSLPDGVEGFAALCRALARVPLLLILDCAEHLGDVFATQLAGFIARTPGIRTLVTSQAPLGIAGETVYRIAELPVPDRQTQHEDAARYGAVALFVTRAAAADRRFELSPANAVLVTEICRRLDGNPLALELAAARVPAFGLSALFERLDDRFRLLKAAGRSSDSRHAALLTAFEWSYDLLTPLEQRVFKRLGAFTGSFSLHAAARSVADDTADTLEVIDSIGRLVDRSLLTVLAVNPPRYVLLETARSYAIEQLKKDNELEHARERMATAMLELLDVAYEEYWSVDETIWLQRYGRDLANVRAALDWAIGRDHALGVALFGSAWPLFVETDLYAESRVRYLQALASLSDSVSRARIGRFWEAIATYDSTRQCDRARYAAELAAKMHAETNDARSHYYALMLLACNWRVDNEQARSAFEAARKLENPAWPERLLAHGALTEGALLTSAGEFVAARAAYQRAMRFALTKSERQAFAASVNIVELDIACGNTAGALQLGRPLALSLRHLGRRDTRFELLVLTFSALLMAGETDEARTTGAELYELALRLDPGKLYIALDAMAFLACTEGRYDTAARIALHADSAHEAQGQGRRRPAEERMRTAVAEALDTHVGFAWRLTAIDLRDPLDPTTACGLALGRCV